MRTRPRGDTPADSCASPPSGSAATPSVMVRREACGPPSCPPFATWIGRSVWLPSSRSNRGVAASAANANSTRCRCSTFSIRLAALAAGWRHRSRWAAGHHLEPTGRSRGSRSSSSPPLTFDRRHRTGSCALVTTEPCPRMPAAAARAAIAGRVRSSSAPAAPRTASSARERRRGNTGGGRPHLARRRETCGPVASPPVPSNASA